MLVLFLFSTEKIHVSVQDCDDTDATKTTDCTEKPCNEFDNRVDEVLNTEGGFVNDPDDLGGATNKGIAWDTWVQNAQSVLGIDPTLENLGNLTDQGAKDIYKNEYWDKINADDIDDGDIRFMLFDFYVNSGSHAVKGVQRTLNSMGYNLTVDGGMGPNTLNAINSANQMDLYNNLKQTRIDFYNGIVQRNPSQSKFLNGWLNRINKFKDKTEEDNQDVNCPE